MLPVQEGERESFRIMEWQWHKMLWPFVTSEQVSPRKFGAMWLTRSVAPPPDDDDLQPRLTSKRSWASRHPTLLFTSLLNNNHSIHQTTVFDIQVSQYDVWNYQIYSSAAARFVRRDSKLQPGSPLLCGSTFKLGERSGSSSWRRPKKQRGQHTWWLQGSYGGDCCYVQIWLLFSSEARYLKHR